MKLLTFLNQDPAQGSLSLLCFDGGENKMAKHRITLSLILSACLLAIPGVIALPSVSASESKQVQTLQVDMGTTTGDFLGGASGTLYGLGDDGSPTSAILDGAQVENSSQKPPAGSQHPSGDALALENQFFSNGGRELAVYMQDYYPDWAYHHGIRPGDERSYITDVAVSDPRYGTFTDTPNNRWDYDEVVEIVVNKVLAKSEHPNQYTFIPFNEPDGGNWYNTGDDANNPLFKQTFLDDWDNEYRLVQRIWNQYKDGSKPAQVRPTADHARVAGPGDSSYRDNRSDAFLRHTKASGTLPDVFVWHELGKESLRNYRSHYDNYRAAEYRNGVSPLPINITEYGELRDMSVPGQLVQWMSMFEETKVQAETAYWNYAGNLSDNMAEANAANAGWWQFKWYGDLRGNKTVKVDSGNRNVIDSLQGIGALDRQNRKGTVLYGGANDGNTDQVKNTGANIPVRVRLTGLDKAGLGDNVDVEVRENAFTGPDGIAATPRVVNVLSNVKITGGSLDVTTLSVDRYASYQLVVTPHQDRILRTDNQLGRNLQVQEAEQSDLSGGARAYAKTPSGNGWSYFMTSGNGDVGNFKDGSRASWTVNAPADGEYRLQVISGNTGFPGTNQVSVDSDSAGYLSYHAELAMKDAAKWLYRGSAQLELHLAKGRHVITIHGSTALDNTLDKFLLYQIPRADDGSDDPVNYPATQFRLSNGAQLDFGNDSSRGFVTMGSGQARAFVHAWDQGFHLVTITYRATKGTSLALAVNGKPVAQPTAAYDGLQSTSLQVAMSDGINSLDVSGSGLLLRDVNVSTCKDREQVAKKFQAEDLQLDGGATVSNETTSNAEGGRYVRGLGNQFVTRENGPEGYGDRTRVVVKDSNNTPTVVESNKGTITIPEGSVPAGNYIVAVKFSNDAFIGRHDYNPQIVDLGLQIRQTGTQDQELARGSFRYTYSDQSFLTRSLALTTNGGALILGNWDPAGSGKGSVSWGVGPNIDSLTFYPLTIGNVTSADLESHPTTPTTITIQAPGLNNGMLTLRKGQKVLIKATVSSANKSAKSENRTVTWSTSDPHIAIIDSRGYLSALNDGKCTITATLNPSTSSSFTLSVLSETSEGNHNTSNQAKDPTPTFHEGGFNSQTDKPSLSSTGSDIGSILGITLFSLLLAGVLKAIKHRLADRL